MQFSRSLSALTVVLLAVSTALSAQGMGSGLGEVAPISGPQTNNTPYALTRSVTRVQTLADGTTITRTFTMKEACDSEGRRYSEMHETLYIRADGQPVNLAHYSVSDPVARTTITWDDRSKIANVITHMPTPETIQRQTQPMPVPEVDVTREPQAVGAPKQVSREDLGVHTIAGIEAKGTRTTSLIPAGYVGNNRPLSIVTEDWISTQYYLPLLIITDDPRTGKRTDEVIEFKPGEPDPALFKIPEGYTVRERTTGQPN